MSKDNFVSLILEMNTLFILYPQSYRRKLVLKCFYQQRVTKKKAFYTVQTTMCQSPDMQNVPLRGQAHMRHLSKKCTLFADCQLVGPGACRGLKWSEGTWPQLVQDRTIDECCTLCKSTRSCTAFSVGKGTKPKKPCFLYNHKDIQPASGLGGECYKIIGITNV